MKNNNPFVAGIADSWYSGNKADLWVEYKYVPELPKRVGVKLGLSALQVSWLRGRHAEGRNVAVIVGFPEGGVVFKGNEWEKFEDEIPLLTLRMLAITKQQIAEWIRAQVSI